MKKIFKKAAALLLALALTLAFAACGTTEDTAVRVITLKGPTGMGMAKLMSEDGAGTTKNDYTFTLSADPTEVSAALIAGSVDIAALPVNLAAVLVNKGIDIRLLAINTLGVLYLLENGNEIGSVADLRGKTICATGQGSTPEYILRYLLTQNGIDPDADVTIEYFAEHAELATRLAGDESAIGMLPEPNVTVALNTAAANGNDKLRIALDMTAEWDKLGGGKLVQGCVVVSGAFCDAHPAQVARFLTEYAASVDFTVSDPSAASALIASYGIVAKAPLAEKAIPNCHICCVTGAEAASDMRAMLSVLYAANPKSVGGKLPDDAFYAYAQ